MWLRLCWSKGCKDASCQTFEESNPGHPRLVPLWPSGRNSFQTSIFDLQRSTVHLWKDLDPVVNIVSAQETGSLLKIDFALSK